MGVWLFLAGILFTAIWQRFGKAWPAVLNSFGCWAWCVCVSVCVCEAWSQAEGVQWAAGYVFELFSCWQPGMVFEVKVTNSFSSVRFRSMLMLAKISGELVCLRHPSQVTTPHNSQPIVRKTCLSSSTWFTLPVCPADLLHECWKLWLHLFLQSCESEMWCNYRRYSNMFSPEVLNKREICQGCPARFSLIL